MNINYFSLFVKSIAFAFIVLALKSCCNGMANASEVSDFLQSVSNDLASDRQKISAERKQHVAESYEATQNGAIAKYVEEHKTQPPTTLGSPIIIAPYYFTGSVQSRDDSPVPVFIINK